MKKTGDWTAGFHREIRQAEEARARGNEGMARVCARRAAGIVAGEYLQRLGAPGPGPSAYDRLRTLRNLSNVPPEAREAADHLLMRITTDGDLPIAVDLVSEARRMAKELLQYDL